MSLEFDFETAIFQTAFKSAVVKHGDFNLLDYDQLISSLEVVKIAYLDVLEIRKDDCLSAQQMQHKDRKLVYGLMCSIFGEKLEYWEPGECFLAVNGIFPSLTWPCILEIIKTFHWNEYFVECLDAIHPISLSRILNDILPQVLNYDNENIIFLVQLLSILIKKCKPNEKKNNFDVHIKTATSFLALQLPSHAHWTPETFQQYFASLFSSLIDIYTALISDDNKKEKENEKYNLELSETITFANLDRFNHISNTKDLNDDEVTVDNQKMFNDCQWLVMFLELCYESLKLLGCYEVNQQCSVPEISKTTNKKLDMRLLLTLLNPLSNQVVVLSESIEDENIQKLFVSIDVTVKHLFNSLSQLSADVKGNVINIIDERKRHYEEYFDNLIANDLKELDCLECMKRNVGLINEQRAHSLLDWIITEKDMPEYSAEYIQQSVLSAFALWPPLIQQRFLNDCLIKYNENPMLMSKHFEEELTTTFNKLVCADVKPNKSLSVQMGQLCIQSPRKTISQTIFQAMNSKAQADVLVHLLKSVSCCCRFKTAENRLTIICDVLNEIILSSCLSEMQFQNLKTFSRKLLKSKPNEMPLVTCVEFLNACVIPYLDQWNPEQGSRLTLFAVQLLQVILNTDNLVKNSDWISAFDPCAILCYLGLIIGQCKFACQNRIGDWAVMKFQTVTALNKLVSIINPHLHIIPKQKMIWLRDQVQTVDENLAFYFVNLFDYFRINLNTGSSGDTLENILEFAACNDINMKLACSNFEKVIKSSGLKAESRLMMSLRNILPYCIAEEWKRISILLDYSLQSNSISILKTCIPIPTKDGKILCDLSAIFLAVIYLCNKSRIGVSFMIQCYRSLIKEKLNGCNQHDENLSPIVGELFIQICYLMKCLSTESVEEAYIFLMELSQMYTKSLTTNYLNVLTSAVKHIKQTTFKNNLLKTLAQTP